MKEYLRKLFNYLKRNSRLDVYLLLILVLPIYIHNLSSSVYGGDAGDIITAALTKGIPHPSGYPLQTMLGILLLKVPIAATPAWKVGLVSSIFSTLTIVIIYYSVLELTKRRDLSLLTSLTLAFTYSFWLYAEIAEVFALNSFFISVLIFLTIKYTLKNDVIILYLIAFFTGLSLTNNQSIIIIFPFIVFTIFVTKWRIIFDVKTIIKGLIYFLAGLIPYIYIPIAAQKYPFMNWGFAVNFENFWYLVTRQYYGWGEGINTVKQTFVPYNLSLRLQTYLSYWKHYIHPLIPFLISLGLIQVIKEKKIKILILLVGSFILAGPFLLIYAGTDFKSFLGIATIERFFISNLIISFLLIPFGIIFLEKLLTRLPINVKLVKILKTIFILVLFLIPTILLIVNFRRTNLNKVNIGDRVAIDILSNLPKDSILMLRNDTLAFNTIYFQQAYDYRTDILIPGMYNGFTPNLKAIGKSDEEIHNHILKHKGGINKKIFNESITTFLEDGKNVYIDGLYEINSGDDTNKIVTVPFGLLYKFEFYKNLPYPKEYYLKTIDIITDSFQTDSFSKHEEVLFYSLTLADVAKIYSADLYRISEYVHKQYQDEAAVNYLIKSAHIDPFNFFINTDLQ
jgi:hypothetical protein